MSNHRPLDFTAAWKKRHPTPRLPRFCARALDDRVIVDIDLGEGNAIHTGWRWRPEEARRVAGLLLACARKATKGKP